MMRFVNGAVYAVATKKLRKEISAKREGLFDRGFTLISVGAAIGHQAARYMASASLSLTPRGLFTSRRVCFIASRASVGASARSMP